MGGRHHPHYCQRSTSPSSNFRQGGSGPGSPDPGNDDSSSCISDSLIHSPTYGCCSSPTGLSSPHPGPDTVAYLSACECAEIRSQSGSELQQQQHRILGSQKDPKSFTRHVGLTRLFCPVKRMFSIKFIAHLCALGSSAMLSLHSQRLGEKSTSSNHNRQVIIISPISSESVLEKTGLQDAVN
ncbi:hypothetical protein RB213_012588 [Colletotrichum asianum]